MDKWESILRNKDKEAAQDFIKFENSFENPYPPEIKWKKICNWLEYPVCNAFFGIDEKVINPHFKRLLVEIKLLSVFGDITWQYFK